MLTSVQDPEKRSARGARERNRTVTRSWNSRRVLSAALLLAATLLAAHPGLASEDPNRPTPWSGVGIQRANDGRDHVYYYRLPARTPSLQRAREVTLRVLARGGAVTASLVDRTPGTTRTYLTCTATPSGSAQADESATSVVRGVAPILVITVPRANAHWSMMVEERMVDQAVRAPERTPTSSSVPVPPVPGASEWPGSLSGAIPEGHAPVYYAMDVPGGPVTVSLSVTTPGSATLTWSVLDPNSPAPPGDFPMWTASIIAGSPSGNPETTTRPPETRTLARGRYIVKVQMESASRASTFRIDVTR